ncbi:hypothetical protein [Peribacillus acanthi]|uniref:hypothetical protein n=1 Tax=Peribacillus acanthi TaxID=2171554 RepID=UPI000D3E22D8|nr:hypothetical protein [Peribacillus acanthi]
MKRFLSSMLILCLFLSLLGQQASATAQSTKIVIQDPLELIDELTKMINTKKWNQLSSLYSKEMSNEINYFYSNKNNEDNHLGYFNIKSLKILDYKIIPTDKRDFYPVTNVDSQLLYVAFDMKVFEETKHFLN